MSNLCLKLLPEEKTSTTSPKIMIPAKGSLRFFFVPQSQQPIIIHPIVLLRSKFLIKFVINHELRL